MKLKLKKLKQKKGKNKMKLPLLNIDGGKADTIEISDKLIKLKAVSYTHLTLPTSIQV